MLAEWDFEVNPNDLLQGSRALGRTLKLVLKMLRHIMPLVIDHDLEKMNVV